MRKGRYVITRFLKNFDFISLRDTGKAKEIISSVFYF